METMRAILTRRSIRKYKPQPVPAEVVKELLEAAMNAPSAGNHRPWYFIVVDDPEIMRRIPEFHPYAQMVTRAPLAIVVCGDSLSGRGYGFWVQDCAAATQNMLLAIHDKGLGGVWLGVYPLQERIDGARKLFNLPEHIMPLSIVVLGYPDEEKPIVNNFDPSKVHHNRW